MSANPSSYDEVRKDVKSMHLFDGTSLTGSYNPLFYQHLMLLFKPKLIGLNNVDDLVLNLKSYFSLEQYTMDNSSIVESAESQDVDWDYIDVAKDIFKKQLIEVNKKEGRSEWIKPLLSFSIDLFENYYIYKQLYPDSVNNPWEPAHQILCNGFMIFISDDREVLDQYNKGIFSSSNDREKFTSLGVVAKSSKNNSAHGFMVDKRHSTQSVVFDYLKRNAPGSNSAKSIKVIMDFLHEQKRSFNYEGLKNSILLPLKRAGLVGSSSNGFYYLLTKDDFIETYQSHLDKLNGIERTIKMYEERYRILGYGDLKYDSRT